jgi:O-antigen/teichoic acid export membrane protein
MGIIVRQSAKTLIVTYAGMAFGIINTLILYPLVLSEEQIGLTRLLINVSVLFSTFAALGAVQIPNRFFPYFNDVEKKHHGFLFFLFSIGVVGYNLFLIFFFAYKDWIVRIYSDKANLFVGHLYYVLPLTAFMLFTAILESYDTIQQKPVIPSLIREFFIRFMFFAGLVLLLFKLISFSAFIILIVVCYGMSFLFLLAYTRYEKLLFLKPDFSIYKSEYFRSISVFCSFVFFATASGTIIANIDSLVLSAYAGLKSTGVYSISFFIATIIDIPRRSMSQAVIGIVSEANKNEDREKIAELYKKSSINQLIIGGLLFLLIWCNIDAVFKLMPHGAAFEMGKWVVFYIGLGKLFDMATGINAEIVGTSKYYKYDLLFYISLGIIAIITSLIFIPLYGLIGAAIASAISICLYNIMRFIFLLVVMRIQPFSFNTLKALLLFGFILALNPFVRINGHFVVSIGIKSAFITAIFVSAVFYFKLSDDILQLTKKLIAAIMDKFGLTKP